MVTWAVLLVCGVLLISYYRIGELDQHLENNIAYIQQEMETSSSELEEEWKALDTTNPEDVLLHLGMTASPSYYDYLIDFNEYLKKKPRSDHLTGTFTTQADEGALLEGFLIIQVSHSEVLGEWHNMSELGRIFLDPCRRYENDNQGFSWEEFKNSDDFGQFLGEFYNFVEDKEDISLQETYRRIEDLGKIKTANIYRKALLQSYIYLAETGYSKYQEHKKNDFMKALVDAEVVYTVYDFSQNWDTKQTAFTVREPFQRHIIHVHSSLLDTGFVFIFSTCIVVAIWIVLGEFGKRV
ncbi:MAG: hypothetical protein HXS42_09240 [Theionarchaea archaeon]|nr:hypothetical protein [Theionarchaea archaeon]